MKIHEKLNWAKIYKIYKEYEPSAKTYLNINFICMVVAFTLIILIEYYNFPTILYLIVLVLILIQWVCNYKSFKLYLKF